MSEGDLQDALAELQWAGSIGNAAGHTDTEVQEDDSEALDKTIVPEKGQTDSGGYAFLWTDVLALGEVMEALSSTGQTNEVIIEAVRKLLAVWRRLREVRVPLSRAQFRVLQCIRTGFATEDAIASKAVLSRAIVDETLQQLESLHYKGNVPLASKGPDGWTTPF